jgi:hypothetical protein
MGLAARAATGLGLVGFDAPSIALAIAVAAILPWLAFRWWGRRAAELGGLLGAVVPWQCWPVITTVVVVICFVLGRVVSRANRDELFVKWIAGVGGAVLFAAALASWPGLGVGNALQSLTWAGWTIVVIVMVVTPRLPFGVAGLAWFAATLCLGPAVAPSPEHRAFVLTSELGELRMPEGTGGDYVVDLETHGKNPLTSGVPLAVLRFAGEEHEMLSGSSKGERLWRPYGVGAKARWREAARYRFSVRSGERPVLFRHPDLSERVTIRVETVGAVRATPPRDWELPRWLLAAAVAVAIIELAAMTWRAGVGVLPWLLLVVASLIARSSVEPLRLLGERLAVDLALAALLAAWLPAARGWLRQRKVFVTVGSLLVPLALATPHLTPPLYGDEPFHLVVMESLVGDHDLDIADDLDLDNHPQNQLYATGRPLFHSPVLAIILLPGYVVAGRSGALVLLALMGAVLSVLIARRARELGLRETAVGLVVLALAITYPMAIFATQIWPELPGALAVAAVLVLVSGSRGGRWPALAVATAAAAIKTRLGLVTLPIAATAWLRRRPLRGLVALTLASGVVFALGWLTMGHPFGPYRRLHDLLPTDPALAARVVAGLAFDAAGGLAFTAPLLLVSVAGMGMLWRRGGTGERAMLIGGSLTLAALMHSTEWYGGGAPPARYLVPLLPAFTLAGGFMLAAPTRGRRLLAILLPPSLIAWWVLVTRPHFSVNPGDGGYWLADTLSRRFAADGRFFFPSFLVMNRAAVVVPVVSVLLVLMATLLARRRRGAAIVMSRAWIALWLVAAAVLVVSLGLRPDRVVEAEAPQVRKSGGRPVPPPGTVARYSHRLGWRLDDGDRIMVPLNLLEGDEIRLEGWLLGTARRGVQLELQWDAREPVSISWSGEAATERVVLAPPPAAGRHRLSITLHAPPYGAAVVDRLVVREVEGR